MLNWEWYIGFADPTEADLDQALPPVRVPVVLVSMEAPLMVNARFSHEFDLRFEDDYLSSP